MEWIIFGIIAVIVIVWLARGRSRRAAADPEAKVIEKENYYVKPSEEGAKPDRPVPDENKP